MYKNVLFAIIGFAPWFFFSIPSSASVTGTVTDTLGNPISRALVMFSSETDSTAVFKAVTDSLGHYVIGDLQVVIAEESPLPFSLGQNYPNPFNPATTIPFALDVSGYVTLTIYNIMGQTVRTLVDSDYPAGSHNALWDGRDSAGKGVSAGVYLYRLVTNGRSQSRKMLLLDGGAVSGGGYSQNVQKTTKQTTGENVLYTITVDRFPFTSIRQEHALVTTATRDYNLQNSSELVAIPGGTFQMGDEMGDLADLCRPVHTVTVSAFDMSKHEITNTQYCAYLNAAKTANIITATSDSVTGASGPWNGSEYIYLAGYSSSYPDNDCKIIYCNNTFSVKPGYQSWPVTWVSWCGSKAFANYYGLDLPTEAEWEYACRGGHQYKYGTDDGTLSTSKANYGDTGIHHPVVVGSYPANPFGLWDMSGNVYEWCHDIFNYYTSNSATDPTGPQGSGPHIARGGGAWSSNDHLFRSAYRGAYDIKVRFYYIGFRVVNRGGGLIY
jgi:formylglycine-generating enzyme